MPQPLFVFSSEILHTLHLQMQLHFPICLFMICREYLPVLEVSGEFPGNNVFHEVPSGVLHCKNVVSIWVVVFLWFGNRSQETVQSLGI